MIGINFSACWSRFYRFREPPSGIVVAILSLWFVVPGALRVPLSGATLLFIAGSVLYEISVGALGILLVTFTGTMGQFGGLVVLVLVILNLCRAVRRRWKACRTG